MLQNKQSRQHEMQGNADKPLRVDTADEDVSMEERKNKLENPAEIMRKGIFGEVDVGKVGIGE
jgi:hypothetical protein